jgi:hypothetical protein
MKGYLVGETLAQQIKTTIARVDGMSASSGATQIPTRFEELGARSTKVFRVCTATGAWPADTSKDVQFYGIESTPNTVSVLNKLVSLPAPKSTATSRIVNIAKDGTQWYLVSFQMSSKTAIMATNTQTITFMGTNAAQTISFISSADTKTLSFAGAGPEQTLTYVSSVSDVDVIASVSASLNTSDCKITVITTTTKIKTANNPTTTTFKTAGSSQTATIVSLASIQTASILSVSGTQSATIMTGTYTATFISLEI